MVKVTTSIKIDNEKRELAKKRGIVLTDLLDQALDNVLGLELKQSTQLQQEKEDLIQAKEILLKEKEDFLKDHESKILEINFKLNSIENALQGAIIEDKEETKQKEYNILMRRAIKIGGIEDNELMADIENYADKYEMTDKEFDDLKARLTRDVIDNW